MFRMLDRGYLGLTNQNLKPFSCWTHAPSAIGALLFCLSPAIHALPEDSKTPLHVRADAADINQTRHKGIYTGNVAVDQGSTHIRAVKAVTEGDDKNQLKKAIITGDASTQAHYWTLQSQDKSELHAFADTICYCPKEHQIVLVGHASVIQDKNKIKASTIRYNTQTQHMSTPFQGEQTTISIQPNSNHSLEPKG